MKAVDEDQMQILHLYVVPEDQLPPKPDYVGLFIAALCSLILLGIVGLLLFSPKSEPVVSFQTTIVGYRLPAVSKIMKITLRATGKGHVNATSATGKIMFYNGQTYTQMIPVGTILTGADGVAVITDAQAALPPAAQTTPPTYGQTSVPAHALTPGAKGNIQAGDINMACCVTSVIAQNPYNFIGGSNARDFTYLSRHDVTNALAILAPTLKKQTIAALSSTIVLNPTCVTKSASSPAIRQETKTATLTVEAICNAVSYNLVAAKKHIEEQEAQLGSLTNIQMSVISLSERKGVIRLRLFITAVVKPLVRLRFGSTGK